MINKQLINLSSPASSGGNAGEEGLILHLDANDVDSYDGDGTEWVDITNHEYTPATNVSEHFNTVLYTGDGSVSGQAITGVGFQPDLIWVKTRNQATRHLITDSVRGVNSQIFSNETLAEQDYGEFDSFDSDGFTVSRNTGTDYFNQSTITYVAWCFKAGGAAVSNTDGTITSQVSANNDLGFSIVKWTGNDTTGATIGHGMSSTPELTIIKNTGSSSDWQINLNASVTGTEGYMNFNTAGLYTTFPTYYTSSNSTVLSSNGTSNATRLYNNQSSDYIAYCFASKRGVSKVGSYTGTGAAGNKVYTGFEPAFILIKSTAASGWIMWDNKRGGDKSLFPFSDIGEISSTYDVDFNGDGFTIQSPNQPENQSGVEIIYYAVAKNTNETSLIPDTDLELHYDPADTNSYSGTGTTFTDLAGNNNGDLLGGIENSYNEEIGNYFDITGSGDGITTSNAVSINPATDGMTVEMWVNTTSNTQNYIFSFDGTGTTYFALSYRTPNNRYLWFYRNSSGGITYLWSKAIPFNEWVHLTITTDGSSAQFYTNGELETDISYPSTTTDNAYNVAYNEDLHFGNLYDLAQNTNTKIGQIRFYKAGLTQDQIRQNYNFTKPSYPNGFDGAFVGLTSSDWNPDGYFFTNSGKYLNLGSDEALNFTTNKTISVWVNPAGSSGNRGILGRFNNVSPYGWILSQSGGNAAFNFYDSSGNGSGTSTATIPINTWTHLLVTYDGSNLIFYKNGSVVSTTATTAIPSSPSANTLIGRYYSNVNVVTYDFIGKISDVKIFDKALIPSEVEAEHSKGYNGIG